MLKRVNVLKTVSEYTPFWDYVNLAHYHTIPDKMYQFATHTPANIDTKCISVELDVDNLMAISLDSYYLTNGHVRHIENFMQLNYGIGNGIENEIETYFNVDDYRLGIFAVSSSILERLLNNEFYEEFVYFIENGMPAPKDLDKLAKEKLMKFEGETLTDFLNYHLTKYKGNIRKFIKNLIELINDSWKEDIAINILKRQTFTIWKEEAKKKYNLKESDFEENTNSKNQDLKMNKNYPLIEPVQSENYPFWVYNNYAYLFDNFNNSPDDKFHIYPNGSIAKPIPFLSVIESTRTGLMCIEDNTFDWIIEKYYGQFIGTKYKGKWYNLGFSISCFSCDFDISENSYDLLESNNEIDSGIIPQRTFLVHSIEVFDNEHSKLYPDSQKLDLLVKEYLKNIEPDFTRRDLNDINLQILKCNNNIDAFFTFHFKEYQGADPHVFVNHSIGLTDEVWNDERPKNTDRKRYFNKWIESKINEGYLERSKLKLESTPKPKPQMNIRLYEDFSHLNNGLTIQFKLPYKFISADINQIIGIIRKYYNDFFYTHAQVLAMNDAFTSKGFFAKGALPYDVHNTPKYFLKEFYITLEEREKINGTDEINEDDLIRVILKERLFIEINDNQDLTDEYLQSVLLVEFDKKRDIFFEELNKLALEFLPQKLINTPEPPQIINNSENKKLTLTGDKVAIYHVFKQLIAKQIIGENKREVAEFLKQNVTGFEKDSIEYLATEIARNRKTNLETGTANIAKKNRIDLD